MISREGLEKSFSLRAIICIGGLNEKNVLECSNLEGFFSNELPVTKKIIDISNISVELSALQSAKVHTLS